MFGIIKFSFTRSANFRRTKMIFHIFYSDGNNEVVWVNNVLIVVQIRTLAKHAKGRHLQILCKFFFECSSASSCVLSSVKLMGLPFLHVSLHLLLSSLPLHLSLCPYLPIILLLCFGNFSSAFCSSDFTSKLKLLTPVQ